MSHNLEDRMYRPVCVGGHLRLSSVRRSQGRKVWARIKVKNETDITIMAEEVK